jgi:SpoIID/LytB domain protein
MDTTNLRRSPARAATVLVAGLLVVATATFGVVGAAGAAPMRPSAVTTLADPITVTGHGWGHGRGMGQWGAFGYAVDQHWTWQQILDHYYAPSVAGNVGNPTVTVSLSQLSPSSGLATGAAYPDTTVVLADAAPTLVTPDNVSHPVLGHAVRLTRTAANTFSTQVAASCVGPWTDAGTVGGSAIRVLPANPGSEAVGDTLGICEPSQAGFERHVLGELRAIDTGGGQATVNALAVDAYIRSVVPREMSASWGDAGNGAGMNALQAQAVAARSYGLASNRYSYANTCDAICQTYPGRWRIQSGTTTSITDPRSDQAVSSTTGVVRAINGAVVATEFSASTGGYTAGGVFNAVPDDGDATSGNPNHDWSTTLARSAIEGTYNMGSLQAINVTGRNGLGADGGRVTAMTLVFSGGSVNLSGEQFRSAFNLKSNWFSFPDNCASASTPSPPFASITALVTQQYLDILDRQPDSGLDYWVHQVACASTTGAKVASLFLTSPEADATLGQVVRLYLGVFGRFPDAGGAFYWQGRLVGGLSSAGLADNFVASQEFQTAHGSQSNADFVAAMYQQMLGRAPDPAGRDYWVGRLDAGTISRAGFILTVSGMSEFRSNWLVPALVQETYLAMLRRTPDPAGYQYWSGVVAGQGPDAFVAGIYNSAEYAKRFSGGA